MAVHVYMRACVCLCFKTLVYGVRFKALTTSKHGGIHVCP